MGGHVRVARLLLDADVDSNLANRCGDTALMAASAKGHVEIALLLLDADSNLANRCRGTALIAVSARICENHVQVGRLLLDAGADSNLANRCGGTALIAASARAMWRLRVCCWIPMSTAT